MKFSVIFLTSIALAAKNMWVHREDSQDYPVGAVVGKCRRLLPGGVKNVVVPEGFVALFYDELHCKGNLISFGHDRELVDIGDRDSLQSVKFVRGTSTKAETGADYYKYKLKGLYKR
jgi:hypothetical protein